VRYAHRGRGGVADVSETVGEGWLTQHSSPDCDRLAAALGVKSSAELWMGEPSEVGGLSAFLVVA
jgi:hypothetical protein